MPLNPPKSEQCLPVISARWQLPFLPHFGVTFAHWEKVVTFFQFSYKADLLKQQFKSISEKEKQQILICATNSIDWSVISALGRKSEHLLNQSAQTSKAHLHGFILRESKWSVFCRSTGERFFCFSDKQWAEQRSRCTQCGYSHFAFSQVLFFCSCYTNTNGRLPAYTQ